MSDDTPTQPTQSPETPEAPETVQAPEEGHAVPVPRDDLTEEVHTQARKEERRAKRWAETKGDLKWAAVALFVLYAIFAVIWQYTGWQRPLAGTEDLGSLATVLFAENGLVAPLEILGVLLLAALYAAVAVAMRDPAGGEEMAAWRAERQQDLASEEREA